MHRSHALATAAFFALLACNTGTNPASRTSRPAALKSDDGHADCGEDDLCSSEFGGWRVTSGRVLHGSAPGTITGSFTLERIDPSSPAQRVGGACFFADLGPGTPCHTDADCAAVPEPQSGHCMSPDGSDEKKACWTRPGGGEYCIGRGIDHSPGTFTFPNIPAAVGADLSFTPRWMIVSCLSDRDPITHVPGCATTLPGHYVYSRGPASADPPETEGDSNRAGHR